MKKNVVKFFCEDVMVMDRQTNPKTWEISDNEPAKHEKVVVRVSLIGSGDTRGFSSLEIAAIIMEKIKEIEKEPV